MNWKTTMAGVLTILGAAIVPLKSYMLGQPVDLSGIMPAITVGVGLIMASDAKKPDAGK